MFLVNYSKDILYLVLAFSVLWLTFFLTWLIYQLVATVSQLRKAAVTLKEQVDHVAKLVGRIKAAFELPSSMIALFFEGLKKVIEMGSGAMEKKRQKRAKTKAEEKTTEDDESVL